MESRKRNTVRAQTNSKDFGWFGNLLEGSEFEFRRCGFFFFERFEFMVCTKPNDMQRDCTYACAVACLHPHNSVSNVVVSLTIHDNMNIYIYISIFKFIYLLIHVNESGKPLWSSDTDVQIVRYIRRKGRKTDLTIQ